MFSSELEYFRQRACEERQRAKSAPTAIVAEVHLALAEKYEAIIANPENREALNGLWRSRADATVIPHFE